MKIRTIALYLSVITLFVFSAGCGSMPVRPHVLDQDLPKEQTTTVLLHHAIKVKEYNGLNIESWNPRRSSNSHMIRASFPGGESVLLFDLDLWIYMGNISYIFRRDDLVLRYTFDAGKEYTIGFHHRRDETATTSRRNRWIVSIEIWEGVTQTRPKDESKVIRSWDIGEF
ncbi:MAG: hypothetical protein FWD28_03980 [Treponema sp.]|nr:hypothetical protein [Treponema sp.]